ncbi:MAG: hypothetical protein Ta2G_16920 [Termitinemataceae bacterium]|nr:hypothetical protein FACS1894102_0870 [Spirochaetia bacterium]GMO57293.1 MAG: hypothetical protein Ta2G_16920 [Termitinemataceae bacterium]
MIKNVIWTSIFILVAGILQSTLLSRLGMRFYAMPDLALVILVYSAYVNGYMTGQLSGFFSGLVLDALSFAPLGLNMLIRTITGALVGLFCGKFFLDIVLLPIVLCSAATLLKASLLFLLNILFAGAVPSYSFSSPVLWVEILFNAVCAPFLFGFLKMFDALLKRKKEI